MKKLFFFLLLIPVISFAQQKEKQIQRMMENIAANEVYIDYLEKGYRIVHSGLNTIQAIKKGDFNLHFIFFDSLKKVNPRIKAWAKVADIITVQLRIIKDSKQAIQNAREAKQFTNEELNYCVTVFDNLLDECLKNIDELVMTITDDNLIMKDGERMKCIDKLYEDMQDKYSFTSSFSNEIGVLSAQRLSEQTEILMSKVINGFAPIP